MGSYHLLNIVAFANLVLSLVQVSVNSPMESSVSEQYLKQRDKLLIEEESTFFGSNLILSAVEVEVNNILLKLKNKELLEGFTNSTNFLPSQHFFQSKERIDRSLVYKFIKKLPKGGSLHTHLLAAVSHNFIIKNFTYRDNLYGGYVNGTFKLKFLNSPTQDKRCEWTLLKNMRLSQGDKIFDKWLREQLILNKDLPQDHTDLESIWKKFKKIFTTTYDFISYKPVFQEYVYQMLQELFDDNVMYTEVRGTVMPLYELDGTTYSTEQFFETFIETVNQFKKNHAQFIGVRYIHSIYRGVDHDTLSRGLKEIIELKKNFPDFIAGFDFVGMEEEGKSLLEYSAHLIEAQNYLSFFFHAGESNWFGHTDLNLADAMLLNSHRIGHGFALTKHPKLLKLGKERNIPLEICPISNQVLMLNQDPRNHPAAVLMSLDYPIVICNDDPGLWNATGLSYDWYIAFMAMTPTTAGLKVLKQWAINSIQFSAMTEGQKRDALENWNRQWDSALAEFRETF